MTAMTAKERKRRQREVRLAERVLVDGRLIQPGVQHGKYSSYTNHGCRCEDCTLAWREFMQRSRAVRHVYLRPDASGRLVSSGPVNHGLQTTYQNWGCRCVPCCAASAESKRRWRESRGGGVLSDRDF